MLSNCCMATAHHRPRSKVYSRTRLFHPVAISFFTSSGESFGRSMMSVSFRPGNPRHMFVSMQKFMSSSAHVRYATAVAMPSDEFEPLISCGITRR